jgi:two-component system, NarL family, sensor histidine kinase DevS
LFFAQVQERLAHMTDERDGVLPAEGSKLTDDALRLVVDAAPDGIVVVDEAGTILFANPMAEQLFEYERNDLVGRSVDLLVPDALRGGHVARRDAYAERPQTRPMGAGLELRARRRSGTEFPVEISLSPVRGRGRSLAIAIVRDITDRRDADEELARARAVLAMVDDRDRIARDLHDTVIQRLFAVGLSLQGALSREVAHPAFERVRRAIDDIDDTIRDIRSAIFALHTRRPGGAGLRADVIAVSSEAARALGFEPAVVFDGPVDSAATDAMQEQLSATLREALSNVTKHARAGKVRIDVKIEATDLVLLVVDDGVGLGEQVGAGNGLANMRERAEGLGGRCEARSSRSGGTILEWRVPIDGSGVAGSDRGD